MIIVRFFIIFSSIDENMKKWPQTETGSKTGAFTLRIFQIQFLFEYGLSLLIFLITRNFSSNTEYVKRERL